MVPAITFFYPSEEVNGAAFLIIRLAELFSKQGYKVHVIDGKRGFLRSQLKSTDVNIIDYTYGDKVVIDFSTYLITPASYLHIVGKEIESVADAKIYLLFWAIHPHNLVWNYRIWPYLKANSSNDMKELITTVFPETYSHVKEVIHKLHDRQAIVFMDYPNYAIPSRVYDLNFGEDEINYVPIPVEDKSDFKVMDTKRETTTLNLLWLGRLADDKTHTLIKLIDDINQYTIKSGKKVHLRIVGDGPYKYLVDKKMRSIDSKLKISLKGTIIKTKLDAYLKKYADIVFAMGTSCLESSQLRIPTVLVHASTQAIRGRMGYTWIFNSYKFSLGSFVNELEAGEGVELEQIIEEYSRNKALGDISYEYVKNNHSMESVSEKLIFSLQRASLTLDQLLADTSYQGINYNTYKAKLIASSFYSYLNGRFTASDILMDIERKFLLKGYKKMAVWGVGKHTEVLLDQYDFSSLLVGLIEYKDRKTSDFKYGHKVMTLNEAIDAGVDVILISSQTFEGGIYSRNIKKCKSNNIELYRLYHENQGVVSEMLWEQIFTRI